MIDNSRLILGPPGCGKTYRLIQEIKTALEAGTHPSRIGVISFTRKAIEEMVSRACAEFDLQPKDFPHMRTSHSFGFAGLGLQKQDVMSGEDYKEIGLKIGLNFEGEDSTSIDDGVSMPTIGGSGSQYLQLDHRSRYRMATLEQEFNREGNHDLHYAKLVQLHEQMKEYKSVMGKYDFVDMIEKYIDIGEPPSLDYLFIDEAQDFTPLQWKMARKIAEFSDRVIIAGDDDQAVHRWTGVEVDLFIKSSDQVERLTQSYRIPQAVHRVANVIAQRIGGRLEKEFLPREEQGTVEYIYHLEDAPVSEGSWTIMARTNYQVQELAKWFRSSGFKFSIKGRPSISDKLVGNILTWEDLCQDKTAGLQRLRQLYTALPKQGEDAMLKRGSMKLLDALAPDAEIGMDKLKAEFGLLRGAEVSAYDALKVSEAQRNYIDAIQRRGEDLLSIPRIKLSTFHAMKGGEDDNCIVYTASTKSCVESLYPQDEHRAFYVGVTRARHNLYILLTDNKYRYTI
jgi:superfamily I DNA/RNA helicase